MPHVSSPSADSDHIVRLSHHYRVERPWSKLPASAGRVTDVCIDRRHRVLVLTRRDPYCDPPGDCVYVMSSDGTVETSWGRGRIADAHMLSVDPRGRIWVVDRDSHEIVAFDEDGNEVASLGNRNRPLEPFNHPTSIAFSTDGRMVVADGYGGSLIHVFDLDEKLLNRWGSLGSGPGQFLNPHGVWVTPDGRVAVADRENGRVQIFDLSGVLQAICTGFVRPTDVWGDPSGNIFVTDAVPSLAQLDPAGNRLGRCRPVLNGAHGLFGDASGNIYLAEGNPSRVTKLVTLKSEQPAQDAGKQ